jgi:hypothetical protein
VICDDVTCPQPIGACCFYDGTCVENEEAECTAAGGIDWLEGETCSSAQCPTFGACCLFDGGCEQEITEDDCFALENSVSWDLGLMCIDVDCGPGLGACCLFDGTCIEVTEVDCLAQDGVWSQSLPCSEVDCGPGLGACCLPDGTCDELTEADCLAADGDWNDGVPCASVVCAQPGACCLPSGSCVETLADDCGSLGGTFQGEGMLCADVDCPQPEVAPNRVGATDKGSVFIFAKVEVRWSEVNQEYVLIQDTFLQLTNDYPENVSVQMYFVNGDAPLPAQGDERAHPGWNWVDNQLELTANQPVYWSAATGSGITSPWTVLDPGDPPGRPAMDGTNDRVLRGFVVGWAVDAISGNEIRWNHLAGLATLVNYGQAGMVPPPEGNGFAAGAAWEYNAWTFPALVEVANGNETGLSPGMLELNGVEYVAPFAQLLMNFQAVGSGAYSGYRQVVTNTDLTLMPVTADLRQETEGPLTTKAHFDVWNENEVKFSGAYRCVTCWDQTLLSFYGIPNHFLLVTLQTNFGKARIDGLASQLCGPTSVDAALLGVVATMLSFDGNGDAGAAGTNLTGMGTEAAAIQWDTLGPPPEAPGKDLKPATMGVRHGSMKRAR